MMRRRRRRSSRPSASPTDIADQRGCLVLCRTLLLVVASSPSPSCCALAFLGGTGAPPRRQHWLMPPPLLSRDARMPPTASSSPTRHCRLPMHTKSAAVRMGEESRSNADKDGEPPAPSRSTELRGLIKMARLNSIPMSAALVGLGAYGARRASPIVTSAAAAATATSAAATLAAAGGLNPIDPTTSVRLTLATTLTILVTTSSMLINDYYDHKNGIDTPHTKPHRPLVTGEVRPLTVKTVLKFAYALHLILLCCVDSMVLRLAILSNTLLTYVYSVHLKPRTGVKNLACAAIVSMAVGVGAIARCGNGNGDAFHALGAVWRPMATVFGLIGHREVVMDIKDLEGDESAGIRTLPVVYGKRAAFGMSLLPLMGAVAACASATPSFGTRAVLASASLVAQGSVGLWSFVRGFDKPSLRFAIEGAPLWLAVSLVALVAGG